jgi:type I restriction enzyme S subunit
MHFSDAEMEAKSLKAGDLLVCEGGDIGRAAIWAGEISGCSFQNHIHRLRPTTHEIDPRFVMHYLQAGFTLLGMFDGAGNRTTIPNLSRTRLAALDVPVPPLREQQAIADVLSTVRQTIELQDQLVRLVRELKQSALQQLFTHGLRGERRNQTEIGLLPESWALKKLESMREFLQYGTSSKCDYESLGNPVLRIPNVADGVVDGADIKRCRLEAREVENWLLEDGDVLFVRTNGVRDRVGSCAVYHGEPNNALFASYLIRARVQQEVLNPDFLQYFSSTEQGRAQLSGRASPAADGKFNINTKSIEALLLPLPVLAEQEEIVKVLQAVDRKVAHHERKRATLKELFKTLLNELMTGRVRVADLDGNEFVTTERAPVDVRSVAESSR